MRDLTKEIARPHRSHGLIWVIALLISALLVWSYFTTFNRVVRATGQVISVARTQLVQNLEGGILTALDVHEGDQVVEGQPLAQFDTTRYEALVDEGEKKIATLVLRDTKIFKAIIAPIVSLPSNAAYTATVTVITYAICCMLVAHWVSRDTKCRWRIDTSHNTWLTSSHCFSKKTLRLGHLQCLQLIAGLLV